MTVSVFLEKFIGYVVKYNYAVFKIICYVLLKMVGRKMIKNFIVFGSCNSRDIFNSYLNPNYKNYFKICGDSQRASLISLMSKPIKFKSSSTEIYVKDSNSIDKNRTKLLREDLSKNFLNTIKNVNADYLLMDNLYEVDCGILELSDGNFITYSPDVRDSKIYDKLEKVRVLNLKNDTVEYLKLFKKHCDLFFNFLEDNAPNLNVILNVSRYSFEIIKDDGKLYENNEFKLISEEHNKYRRMLDNYIMNKYDVEILPFNFNTVIFENHPFGYAPSHFPQSYLSEKTNQIRNIVVRNSLLNKDMIEKIRRMNIKLFMLNELNFSKNDLEINSSLTSEKDDVAQIEKNKEELNNEYFFLENEFDFLMKNLKKCHDHEFFDEAIECDKQHYYANYNGILITTDNRGTKVYSNTMNEGFYYINMELDKDNNYEFAFEWIDGNYLTPIIQIREVDNMNVFVSFQKEVDNVWRIYTNNSFSSLAPRLLDFEGKKSFKQCSINPHDKIKLIKNNDTIKLYCEDELVIDYPIKLNSNFYLGLGGHALRERYTKFKNLSLKLIK